MKSRPFFNIIIAGIIILGIFSFNRKQFPNSFEYYQFTTIESVVPMGFGRSRIISTDENGLLQETKLKNFFSATGINFKNIKMNDFDITKKIKTLSEGGWMLVSVTPGVYSADKSTGIFITRYLFRR